MKPDRQWFVGYKQLEPVGSLLGFRVNLIGPLRLSEVPQVLQICFEGDMFDGIYEWDGVPDAEQISRVVKSGKTIGTLPQALRLIVSPRFANNPKVVPMDEEMIRDTIGLTKAEEN